MSDREGPRSFDRCPAGMASALPTAATTGIDLARAPGVAPDGAPAVARYRIREVLGQGGMGIVYLAFDVLLGREVAIKQARRTEREDVLLRFLIEARVAGSLEHPSILRVHDLGVDDGGLPYLVAERVVGAPWHHELPGQTLRRRLEVLERVAEAVEYAHGRGVLHRDLKPANVLLGPYGEVLLADWGLARVEGAPDDRPSGGTAGSVDDRLTSAGGFLGTPGYAAPEQATGELHRIGPTSDVYALGAILHECLAGRPPFRGPHPRAVLRAQLAGPPPAPPGAPAALVSIARRALAPRPSGRYPSAAAFRADLVAWRAGRPLAAHRETLPERARRLGRRHPRSATALVVAAVLAPLVGLAVAVGRSIEIDIARRAALDATTDDLDLGRRLLDDVEGHLDDRRPDRAELAERLRSAREALVLAERSAAALDDPTGGARLESEARTLRADSHRIEARLAIRFWTDPTLPGPPPVRRAGAVWTDVLDSLAAARTLGADDPALDELELRARGTGPLRVRTVPPEATIEIRRLAVGATEPGFVVATLGGGGDPIDLDAGGYLLRIEHADRHPVRLPVYLVRGVAGGRDLVVDLPPAGSVPPGYVHVPAGPYLAPGGDELRHLDRPFAIAATEISLGQWARHAATLPDDETGRFLRRMVDQFRAERSDDWQRIPAIAVSHEDLAIYCRALSAGEPGRIFDLPTTAQWERATSGADGRRFPWGDAWDEEAARIGRTVFGLLGASGNAREWLRDGPGDLRPLVDGSAYVPGTRGRLDYQPLFPRGQRMYDSGGRLVIERR